MSTPAKAENGSLQAHDIYLRSHDALQTCPAELQEIFQLIRNIRDLKSDHFGGYERTDSGHSQSLFTPRQRYEQELKNEADELSVDCCDGQRADDIESTWVETLGQVVFYRFNREQEEKYKRDRHHHCFICRKHFPIGSRPLISRTSQISIAHRVKKWSEDKKKDQCKLTSTEHFNLPNFITVRELAYSEFENEKKKIPDLTIGLHTYDLNEWTNSGHLGLLQNDRVRLFDQKILRRLEDKGYLTPPFIRSGSSARRVGDMSLTFPFAFWEAKREGGGYDHQSARKQNALKVKMLLSWQDQIGKMAEVPWLPLVWYFVSVGSKWEVHGCHFQQNSVAKDGRICVLLKLWTGDSADADDALQLLYIVDIIALWGEHKYKPFAGACISRLMAKLRSEAPPALEQTLLAHQLEINRNNFSWLFPEQEKAQLRATSPSVKSYRSKRLQSPQLVEEIEHLSLTSHQRDYIIPERDFFIWLLDRDPKGGDLLIVRVDEEGSVLPPLLIFESPNWERRDFRRVIKEEQARLPNDILTDFRIRRDGSPYVKKCVARKTGYFQNPQSQFCAIVPLDSATYRRQRNSISARDAVFRRFEKLLHLPEIIDAAQEANDKWCLCEAVYNEYSPNMILCDNLKCPLGWYHMKCVGLDEDFTADSWFCKQCLVRWHGNECAEYQDDDIDEEIREASDARIQRIKTFARTWKDHKWPRREKVRSLIDRTSYKIRIKMDARNTYDIISDVNTKKRYESSCWAILRSSPEEIVAIGPIQGDSVSEGR